MDIAKADAFGVEIRNDIKATIIRLNIATAARFSSGGTEIMEAQRKIKAAYTYDHCHGAASIKGIMKRLATANKQWDRAAFVALKGFANLVIDKEGTCGHKRQRPPLHKQRERAGSDVGEQEFSGAANLQGTDVPTKGTS